MKNECLAAALQELSAAGVRDVDRAYGGKHLQLRWRVNGTERMYSLPITPSDFRSAANTRAQIRRILREDGMLLMAERKPPERMPSRIERLERRVGVLETELKLLRPHFGPR